MSRDEVIQVLLGFFCFVFCSFYQRIRINPKKKLFFCSCQHLKLSLRHFFLRGLVEPRKEGVCRPLATNLCVPCFTDHRPVDSPQQPSQTQPVVFPPLRIRATHDQFHIVLQHWGRQRVFIWIQVFVFSFICSKRLTQAECSCCPILWGRSTRRVCHCWLNHLPFCLYRPKHPSSWMASRRLSSLELS